MTEILRIIISFFFLFKGFAVNNNAQQILTGAPTETSTITQFTVINTYYRPGTQYYTEGLAFSGDNVLIESAGLYGSSEIHYLNFAQNITVTSAAPLDSKFFGEGCVIVVNNGQKEVYQLTWQERAVFVYNADNLELIRTLTLPSDILEGWGMTTRLIQGTDNTTKPQLLISDGTNSIYGTDLDLNINLALNVATSDGIPINKINELEYIDGKIWANIYFQNRVAIIDPETGVIENFIDFSPLQQQAFTYMMQNGVHFQNDYVLNGIAYNSNTNQYYSNIVQDLRILISGKMWPLIWEIQVDSLKNSNEGELSQ